MDHEGNVSPWLTIAHERNLTVKWVRFDRTTWQIQPDAFAAALGAKTRLVALNLANNLTGSINDVRPLIDVAHAAGALVYLDAVAFAPHRLVDVIALGCDFLTCSSYKFFGPHMGIVWGREDLLRELYPYKVRPQTDELPYRFEPGTPQIEQLAALAATVDYFDWLGKQCSPQAGNARDRLAAAFNAATEWETNLVTALIDGLRNIAGTRIVGIDDPARFHARVPTVSAVFERRSSAYVAAELARDGIFVWNGHNFALETVRALGIDEDDGVVRIGLAHYNVYEDIERLLRAVSRIVRT
jgi:cysteine desulfurase family protein (TIGR01976 family)